MNIDTAPVLFTERVCDNGKIVAIATLNAPKALNALNLEMIRLLTERFSSWLANDEIAVIVLEGAGDKAFCAGGDVVSVYRDLDLLRQNASSEQLTEQQVYASLAYQFFHQEYHLDQLIHHATKPILVLADGYVMGGGIGLLAGASHKVATERTIMAMPEITIGLYPDVGASYFLNKMPHGIGLFLGLTGCHFNGSDGKYLGLIDKLIASSALEPLKAQLEQINWQEDDQTNQQYLSELLNKQDVQVAQPIIGQLELLASEIDKLTTGDDILAIYQAILNYQTADKWFIHAQQKLQHGSPLSVHLIYQQLRRCQSLSLEQCFEYELQLSLRCSQYPEFSEGVRALLVDKDKAPQWTYKAVNDVDDSIIDWFFNNK